MVGPLTWDDIILFLPLVAAALLLIGYLGRDQLWLRGWTVLGYLVFAIYFIELADVPLWPAVLAAALIVVANLYMIGGLLRERRHFKLSGEEMMLFARLPGLTPGQFKMLLEDATWHQAHVPTRLTTAGQMPKALHFILEGKAEVERGGQRFDIGPHCFVGELAFLRGAPATATAHSKVGALYVSWDPEKLRALMNKNDEVSRAFSALLSGDLAEKIARSGPSSRA